jgi:hypothetical protein
MWWCELDCWAGQASARQSHVREAGCGARRRRSMLRTDCPAMLGLPARGQTRFVRFAHCTQTAATSQLTKRALRAAESPALLGASHARPSQPPERASAQPEVVSRRKRTARWLRGGRYPAGAISVAVRSAGSRSARASALRHLTRRVCLSEESKANGASSATRPRREHRNAVDAQHRPPQHERPPGAARRDAPAPAPATTHAPTHAPITTTTSTTKSR